MPKYIKFLIIGTSILAITAASHADPAARTLSGKVQDITLPILTPAGSGSIAIIGKKGPNYTFLTSAHVINKTLNLEVNSIDLSSQAGRELFVPAVIEKNFSSDGVDSTFQYSGKPELKAALLFSLAPDAKWEDDPSVYKTETLPCNDESIHRIDRCIKVEVAGGKCYYTNNSGNYQSCNKYPTVKYTKRLSMGTYERLNGTFQGFSYFIKTGTIGDLVVAGYSLPSRSINTRILRSSNATPKDLLKRNKDGYKLIYETTSTVPGMSGGPVMGNRLCPRKDQYSPFSIYSGIVGIHGRSEEYGNTQSRSGLSLGVPITNKKVIQFLTLNAKDLGIPATTIYEEAVKEICNSIN